MFVAVCRAALVKLLTRYAHAAPLLGGRPAVRDRVPACHKGEGRLPAALSFAWGVSCWLGEVAAARGRRDVCEAAGTVLMAAFCVSVGHMPADRPASTAPPLRPPARPPPAGGLQQEPQPIFSTSASALPGSGCLAAPAQRHPAAWPYGEGRGGRGGRGAMRNRFPSGKPSS